MYTFHVLLFHHSSLAVCLTGKDFDYSRITPITSFPPTLLNCSGEIVREIISMKLWL